MPVLPVTKNGNIVIFIKVVLLLKVDIVAFGAKDFSGFGSGL